MKDQDVNFTRSSIHAPTVTERLRQSVPLAQAVGFRLEEIGIARTRGVVPATSMALNQNGTFQASVFYLLADYTVGLAAFASMAEHSLFGLHQGTSGFMIQGWLKDGMVRHLRPATREIQLTLSVSDADQVRLRTEIEVEGRSAFTGKGSIIQAGSSDIIATISHTVVFKRLDPLPV